MTLAEILADAQKFSDDLVFKTADGSEIKLGDMRAHKKTMDGETATAKKMREQAEAAAKEAADILTALQKAAKELTPAAPKKEEKAPAWREDPLYQPLVPLFDALEKQAKDSLALATAVQKQLAQSQSFYMIERMRSEYNAAPEAWRKRVTFEQAVAEALKSGDVEAYGQGEEVVKMPTLRKRIHESTEEDRITARVTEAVATEKAKWEREQKVNSVSKPGKFQTRGKSGEAPIKKIEDLNSETVLKAMQDDPEFAKQMEGSDLIQ